jgi:predicted acyltransferase (DUF342 family)
MLANVALSDTFDTWRTRTNQIIVNIDQVENSNIRFVSNTSTINVTGNVKLGQTVYIGSNALPTTGGTINGELVINGNVRITGILDLL